MTNPIGVRKSHQGAKLSQDSRSCWRWGGASYHPHLIDEKKSSRNQWETGDRMLVGVIKAAGSDFCLNGPILNLAPLRARTLTWFVFYSEKPSFFPRKIDLHNRLWLLITSSPEVQVSASLDSYSTKQSSHLIHK